MKYLAASTIALLALAAPAGAEIRSLSGFTEVQARDNIVVEVRTGPAFVVDVSGPQADRIVTAIDDNALKISERNRPWFGPDRRINALVRITLPKLDGLAAAKGATLRAYDISADDMSLVAAMGAVLEINGTCRAVDATAAMGGTLRAQDFRCQTADTTAAMGGDVRVFATDTFDATAAMGGNIRISGGAHGPTTAAMGGSIQIADGGRSDDTTAVMGGNVETR